MKSKLVCCVCAMLTSGMVWADGPDFDVVSSSVVTPSATGGTSRSIFIGLGYVRSWTDENKHNVDFVIGGSVGDAKKNAGLVLALANDSADIGSDKFKNRALSLRFNRYLSNEWSVAFGVNNLFGSGFFTGLAKSAYGVVTGSFRTRFLPVQVSLGAGTGAFHSVDDLVNRRDNKLGVFANLGVGITKNLSIATDWNAKSLALGVSGLVDVTPKIPVALGLGILNVAGDLQPGAKRNTLVFTAAYAHVFK